MYSVTWHRATARLLFILLFHLSAFSEAVSLACLVKADIVSPYSGILINTGAGKPVVPIGTSSLSKASPERSRGRLLVFNLFIKRPRLDSFISIQSNPPLASSSNTQSSKFRRSGPSMMSRSDLQGRWMPSSITEEDVRKLRDSRYVTGEISHRLPAQGQAIPTP